MASHAYREKNQTVLMTVEETIQFKKNIAIRIASASCLVALCSGCIAWFVARENAETEIVALATEEAHEHLHYYNATDLGQKGAKGRAESAVKALSIGIFDIVELYDAQGNRIAEAMSDTGKSIERHLPHHKQPLYTTPFYESIQIHENTWVLRVLTPVRASFSDTAGPILYYLEAVRVIPLWQKDQINHSALVMALMSIVASLLCGGVLYPVITRLSAAHERAARQLIESQETMIDTLQKSEQMLENKVEERTTELRLEQQRTKELLYNILPREIAEELVLNGTVRPRRHESVSILFTDFQGFTQAVSAMPADRMLLELNEIFAAFDAITDECGIEKIKTIGDAYMAAAGFTADSSDHACRCVRAGISMLSYLRERNRTTSFKWLLRIGIHSGPVVTGVIGVKKYAFDVWGDTVNIAARMENSGEIEQVNISAYTYDLVRDHFACNYRGKLDAKGKGNLDMYSVIEEMDTCHV